MTDLMYLSSTTSICHIGEKVVKSTTYSMYLSRITSIRYIHYLVVDITTQLYGFATQLSGKINWTYELSKVYGWVPGQKYP